MGNPPCHSPIRLGSRLIFFFLSQWKTTEIQSLKPPVKVMFRAFHWTCSKSSRAGLISLLVSIAEAAVPQGEQLWGLYMATCTKGRPWANLVPGVWWRVEREWCTSRPLHGALTGLVSRFLSPSPQLGAQSEPASAPAVL